MVRIYARHPETRDAPSAMSKRTAAKPVTNDQMAEGSGAPHSTASVSALIDLLTEAKKAISNNQSN
jgi:hypothetical protein